MIPLLVIFLLSSALANENVYTTVKIGNQRTLDCKTTDPITWGYSKNNTEEETPIAAEENVYKIDGSKLVLLNVQEEHLGFYKCSTKDDDHETLISFEVDISFKLKKMAKSISIDEGSSTELKCSLHSSGQEVIFKWFSKPEYDSEEESERTLICSKSSDTDCSTGIVAEALFDKRDKDAKVTPIAERSEITTGEEDGIPYSIFKIKNAFLEDRKIYICQAVLKEAEEDVEDCEESKESCQEVETILRVKDPLAAVWPFIGIVAEVVLLCVIIFFCERRKSDEKDDYDEGHNGK